MMKKKKNRRGSFSPMIQSLVVLTIAFLPCPLSAQTLLEQLTKTGIDFGGYGKQVIPSPTLSIHESSFSDETLEKITGQAGWEKFSQPSAVAPMMIRLEYVKNEADERIGHNVHSAFAVHAKLQSIQDKDLMQQIFGRQSDTGETGGLKLTELTAEQLKKITAASSELNTSGDNRAAARTYSMVDVILLDKIRIHGLLGIEKTEGPSGFSLAWQLLLRNEPDELQGIWSKVAVVDGRSWASDPVAYAGWGGYIQVTRVSQSPEILVIESRMLMHEPMDWFSSSNYIRSKLPLVIQEGARNFRRKFQERQGITSD
jgi:hypothetical protein